MNLQVILHSVLESRLNLFRRLSMKPDNDRVNLLNVPDQNLIFFSILDMSSEALVPHDIHGTGSCWSWTRPNYR